MTDKIKSDKLIKVGSRESKLAVIQSEMAIKLIEDSCPQYRTQLITMKTTGDKILDRTLDKVGGKGLFVKELDKALYNEEVDITVHSLKDVPMDIDESLPIIAYLKREYPYDVLVLPKGKSELDFDKPIGSASLRRSIQAKKLFPQAKIMPVRGNVLTRLEKLDRGDYSALILAQAGLERLGLGDRISCIFTEEEILPAAGQGIIAVQGKINNIKNNIGKYINDENAEICAKAERAFVRALNGGCSSPVAGYAVTDGEKIKITGFYADNNTEIKQSIEGMAKDGEELGKQLAEIIKNKL